jgi:NTE family protein
MGERSSPGRVADPPLPAALARVPLFAGLDQTALLDVERLIRLRRHGTGQLICAQGEPSDRVFVVRSGLAYAVVTSMDGSRTVEVARLRPGDVIGEVGVVTDLPRSASVMARSEVTVMELAREDFIGLLARHPLLQRNLAQLLGGRLAHRNADLRGRRGGVTAIVVGRRRAELAARIVEATRRASPDRVAVLDLTQPAAAARAADGCDALAVGSAIEHAAGLVLTHPTVLILVDHGDDRAGPLFDHADRVLALLDQQDIAASEATLLAASAEVELVLLADAPGPAPRGARLVRRCAGNGTAGDVAWLGRHLSHTKLGLALGAGGAKAFAHAGVLQVLERAGYTIDYVAGSSMGAVVAVWLALGMTASEIATTLESRFGTEAAGKSVFRRGAAGDGVEVFTRIFRETTADRSFADLMIPATVMAADLTRRCPAPIATGPLWQALMAALSIPGLYPPWARDNQRLVDAVSLTPVPLDAVVEAGADITIAVNLLGREALPRWPDDEGTAGSPIDVTPGFSGSGGRVRDTVVEVLELAQLEASTRVTAQADVPITPRFGPCTWRHVRLGPRFLAAGAEAAETQLARLATLARPSGAPG